MIYLSSTFFISVFLGYVFLFFHFSLNHSTVILGTHFVDLAYAFLHGHLNLINFRLSEDFIDFKGKNYIYFGPLSAMLLIPFVFLFGLGFPQIFISLTATATNFYFLYKIAFLLGIKNKDSAIWLAGFFIFGTIYIFMVFMPLSAYIAQLVGVTFVIAAIWVFLQKKASILLCGALVAIAGLSRLTFYLAIVFFIFEFILKKETKNIFLFLIPIVFSLFVTFGYNYARFRNIFESGYSYVVPDKYDSATKTQGIFNLKNIPRNLYLLLYKSPDPVTNQFNMLVTPYLKVDQLGLGIFFTSPLFLYLILISYKNKYVISSLLAIIAFSIVELSYFGSGLSQYGYRYALDFYPFLFIMLVSVFRKSLPKRAKILIVYSVLFGFCYSYSILGLYPF